MGLYIGCVLLWIFGAFNKSLTVTALWCMFVFMLGIGLGRLLSLILDGMPDMIFVFFMIFEFIAAGITFYYSRQKLKVLFLMVPRGGIEPPTQGFSVLCSTN